MGVIKQVRRIIKKRKDVFVKNLGLNDARLKMVRRIWIFANKTDCNIKEYDNSKRKEFLYKFMEELPWEELDMLFNFFKDSYWRIAVEKYDYFTSLKL